ncbi:MAG: hypothetical protein KJ607_04090 [Bacteroidetes bacterium]|nr:hypothetical protein [Bacteroidota bacterium]
MKTILPLLLLLIVSASVTAQLTSNLIVFTEQGEKFYLILNGIRQNENAETNVRVTDLTAPSYKVKIIFEDQRLGEFDKTIYFNEQGVEVNYVVKRNKKEEYVLRFMNSVPVAQAPAPPPTQATIVYTTTPPATTMTFSYTESTTTTTGTGNPDGASFGMNVNDEGMNMNVNINMSGTGTESTTTTTSYSTTTTTSTTTGGAGTTVVVPVQAPPVYVPGVYRPNRMSCSDDGW